MSDESDNSFPLTNEPPVGTARMEADGTIVVNYRSKVPEVGPVHALMTFKPDHPKYRRVMRQVPGGLKPGDEKLLYPLSDE